MKFHKDIILLFLFSFILICYTHKEAKQFSLFSIVSFKQEECSAVSTTNLKGICMTTSECAEKGTADGNCAASFGVCCVISVSACGGAVTQNCSYIENPGYPSTYTTTGDCTYTVTRCQDDICQIRLDFVSASLQQPNSAAATAGTCTNTILDITGGSSSGGISDDPPNLCGTLTGQHVYVDSGRASTATTLKFTLASSASNTWRIKVTQIECWNPSRAPEDCLQYYYGAHRHTVKSFNYDGTSSCSTGCMLNDQYHKICFRPEKGMCTSGFSESAVSSSEDAFGLNGEEDATSMIGNDDNCETSMILIHAINSDADDSFCGSNLNSESATTTGGVVYAQTSNGFQFTVLANEALSNAHTGYNIDVQQIACGQSTFGATQITQT